METERIALNQRERDRLKVLHEAQQKHLTQGEAAKRLKVTDRQVRRLLLALEKRGDAAVVHGLRGRASNHKLAASHEQRILARVRQRYADFGPTLAAEHLAQEGLVVSRETLRKWMTRAQLWRPRALRVKTIHVWRERRACFGEMVMQDSSPFRWLEERGPACALIAVIDDATSRMWARLVEHDTTEENLRTLGGWLQRYGRPLAHYTDKNSIFRHRSGAAALQEQLRGEEALSQFGRALKELGIEWIAAHSPQEGNAFSGDRQHRWCQPLFGDALPGGVGTTFHGGASPCPQCASPTGWPTAAGRNSECARGTESGAGPYRQLGRSSLGRVSGGSVCRASWSRRGNRTTAGWLALAALSETLSALAALPGCDASIRKSFRPTASRTCETKSPTP